MKIPSTKNTIGCAKEVKQPEVPKGPFAGQVLYDIMYKKLEEFWFGDTIKSMGNHRSRFEKL